jgi:hypothetical protein
VVSEEYIQTQKAVNVYKSLPVVRIPDEPSRPLGHGGLRSDDLNFEMMINMRRAHQTKHAATGVRTKKSKPTDGSIRGHILQEFHEALKEAQDEHGAGTGLERVARWHEREPAPGGRNGVISGTSVPDLPAGNEANAAVAAANVAKMVRAPPILCCQCRLLVKTLKIFLFFFLRQQLDAKTSS